ncbi:unnamed protein product [Rotaria magnacalcarata]|uniref:Uncharacterized protein n=1 Tax=Rotaria magnacalcarata TaxID=392030 RepID=A0A816VRN0_9BILA|nr:unnamed protein product [Rotaria magnacalcarata]CAF4081586.1 unnamed protein product [Rotaria magnacalcarata]CAF4200241.1 unnamed protein product [Rotaria magnacalcarata]CAF5199542.1 unnamed protein product [Rotaria magnacalcarata]
MDKHLRNHFTKDRIKKHLHGTGLLNRSGRFLTEVEYQNRFRDIETGRQNVLKYDEALLEMLIVLGEEQYKLFCQEMEKIKKELQCKYRQAEIPDNIEPSDGEHQWPKP